jgi:hypothetical protein
MQAGLWGSPIQAGPWGGPTKMLGSEWSDLIIQKSSTLHHSMPYQSSIARPIDLVDEFILRV